MVIAHAATTTLLAANAGSYPGALSNAPGLYLKRDSSVRGQDVYVLALCAFFTTVCAECRWAAENASGGPESPLTNGDAGDRFHNDGAFNETSSTFRRTMRGAHGGYDGGDTGRPDLSRQELRRGCVYHMRPLRPPVLRGTHSARLDPATRGAHPSARTPGRIATCTNPCRGLRTLPPLLDQARPPETTTA